MAARRRAFTLIELLVVLGIISMVLTLALPSMVGIMRGTRIMSTASILEAAVGKTRSTAISKRRPCSVDLVVTRDSQGKPVISRLTSSSMLVMDDFEPYPAWDVLAANTDRILNAWNENWTFEPDPNDEDAATAPLTWRMVAGYTRELWAGQGSGSVSDAYAWAEGSRTLGEPDIDLEMTMQARFKILRINPELSRPTWGFGLLAHFARDSRKCVGYRFRVTAQSSDEGWNLTSRAELQKIYSPGNPNPSDADISAIGRPGISEREKNLDSAAVSGMAAVLAPGVWYKMTFTLQRHDRILSLWGKIWVDGAPEPVEWTVGPCYDEFEGGEFKDLDGDTIVDQVDAFDYRALAGGYAGVWVGYGEIGVDDFTVDARDFWLVPGGVEIQTVTRDPDTGNPPDYVVAVPHLAPGGFPVSYRPDGTSAVNRPVFIRIIDTGGAQEMLYRLDQNTGRVAPADKVE